MHYVSLLRELRKKNGLTQQQVADFLHIDRSTYAYYESGRTKVNVDLLLRLSRFYQMSLGTLVGEDRSAAALSDGTEEALNVNAILVNESVSRFAQLSREEQYLVILYRSGTQAQREELLLQANAITEPEKK